MKLLTATSLFLVALAASAGNDRVITMPTVDLTQPGALEHLRSDDPGRYKRVQEMLEVAETADCAYTGPAFIPVMPSGKGIECGMIVYTSLPAKRRVSFIVDDTFYTALVAMRYNGELFHARARQPE